MILKGFSLSPGMGAKKRPPSLLPHTTGPGTRWVAGTLPAPPFHMLGVSYARTV